MAEKKLSYWEQLRDPRWQEMRLRVMEDAGFECENCGDNRTTLNVHHTYYERGLSPWEYPRDTLLCLCEPCHEEAQERMKVLQREIGRMGLHTSFVIGWIRGWLARLEGDDNDQIGLDDYEVAEGIGWMIGLTAEEVLSFERSGSCRWGDLKAKSNEKFGRGPSHG